MSGTDMKEVLRDVGQVSQPRQGPVALWGWHRGARKAPSAEQRGIAAGQRPDKDFGRLFTFASDKGFLE